VIHRRHVVRRRLSGDRRCAATGALVLIAVYFLCWVGAVAGYFPASHMYLSLFTFTTAAVASGAALGAGLCSSLVFGAIAGAATALAYSLFGFMAPE